MHASLLASNQRGSITNVAEKERTSESRKPNIATSLVSGTWIIPRDWYLDLDDHPRSGQAGGDLSVCNMPYKASKLAKVLRGYD